MIRVSVMLHPADGSPARELAAVAIAQRGPVPGSSDYRYVAVTSTDGRDGDVPRAAVLEHDRTKGVLELVRLALASATPETVDELIPELRRPLESLARVRPSAT